MEMNVEPKVIEHLVDDVELYSEKCPCCGSDDADCELDEGCYTYVCMECEQTWCVTFEEVHTSMQWTDKEGVTHVRQAKPAPDAVKVNADLLDCLQRYVEADADMEEDDLLKCARALIAEATSVQ